MIEIFICEDDAKQLERNVEYINNYILMEQLDMKITLATHDPDILLNYLKYNKVQGLYFLDVNLGHEMSGIVLGAEIRKYNPTGSIVFITTHTELSYLTFMYKVEALDYIIKDDFTDLKERIIDCIITVNERHIALEDVQEEQFHVKMGDKVINEDYENILFFETASTLHKIVMYTTRRNVEFYGRIGDLPGKHPFFYRCHNSYVVNIENIAKINSKSREVIMNNGAICYVSVRRLKGLINEVKMINPTLSY